MYQMSKCRETPLWNSILWGNRTGRSDDRVPSVEYYNDTGVDWLGHMSTWFRRATPLIWNKSSPVVEDRRRGRRPHAVQGWTAMTKHLDKCRRGSHTLLSLLSRDVTVAEPIQCNWPSTQLIVCWLHWLQWRRQDFFLGGLGPFPPSFPFSSLSPPLPFPSLPLLPLPFPPLTGR